MNEDLQRQIAQLTAQLEEQKLQILHLTQTNSSVQEEDDGNDEGAIALPNRSNQLHFNASRIPDAIKLIATYKGERKSLSAWLASVESKLEHAKKLCSSEEELKSVMPLWISVIRDKIVDEASDALVASHTDCEWDEIKRVLTEYFGDKRDLCGLVTQITYLRQGTKDITHFYNECRELLSDIVAKLSLDSTTKNCVQTLSKSYEYMILNSFVDGLNEPYATLTRASRPDTLHSAYQSALEQYNADLRRKEKFKTYIRASEPTHMRTNRPPLPPNARNSNTFNQNSSRYYSPTYYQRPFHYQQSKPMNQNYQRNPIYSQNTNNTPTPNFPHNYQNRAIKNEPMSQQSRFQNNNNRANAVHCHECHPSIEQLYIQSPENQPPQYEHQNEEPQPGTEIPVEEYSEPSNIECENLNFHAALGLPQEE